ADQKAELVAKAWLPIVVMAVVSNGRRGGLISLVSSRGLWGPAKFVDRAEANSVCFAEGAVDSSGFSNSQFRPSDQRGDIRRLGLAITHESSRPTRFVNRGPKNPPVSDRIRLSLLQNSANSDASFPLSY